MHPRTAQVLARHSTIVLTMAIYTKPGDEVVEAVGRLPSCVAAVQFISRWAHPAENRKALKPLMREAAKNEAKSAVFDGLGNESNSDWFTSPVAGDCPPGKRQHYWGELVGAGRAGLVRLRPQPDRAA